MKEDGASEGMTALTLVEDGMRSAAQFCVEQPVADEDRAFDPPYCLMRTVRRIETRSVWLYYTIHPTR